jgi:hypothetical protein
MDSACFPWRPLGELLVERGILTEVGLEMAITEQRRTGRLLGVILVESGRVGAGELARALAEQHGVELRAGDSAAGVMSSSREQGSAASKIPGTDGWRRPLGVLLVEWEFLAQSELDSALDEQRRRPELRLGEILVSLGYLSGPELARALALQHGVYVPEDELNSGLETVIVPAAPGQHVYLVADVVFDPDYRPTSILYSSTNLLEASEFAMEHVDEHEPKALEIQRVSGTTRETVWTYSEARSAALVASRKRPVEMFGFDPINWGAS